MNVGAFVPTNLDLLLLDVHFIAASEHRCRAGCVRQAAGARRYGRTILVSTACCVHDVASASIESNLVPRTRGCTCQTSAHLISPLTCSSHAQRLSVLAASVSAVRMQRPSSAPRSLPRVQLWIQRCRSCVEWLGRSQHAPRLSGLPFWSGRRRR